MKKLFVKTYGCQMNAYDSARMADLLAPLGYVAAAEPEGADMVILNTCHIREKAADKVYSELGRLGGLKRGKRDMLIAVAGCVAQAEGEEILRRAPQVDLVVGPQTYHRLPEMIAKIARGEGRAVEADFPALEKFDSLVETTATGISAFLTVQEGCDKFCTFCVVPYTRGAGTFAPAAKRCCAEARGLTEKGARESVLLGQNVNAYNGIGAGRCGMEPGAAMRSTGEDRRHCSHPLHHQPSSRHGGRFDRRPWRQRKTDALSASAGAIRFG